MVKRKSAFLRALAGEKLSMVDVGVRLTKPQAIMLYKIKRAKAFRKKLRQQELELTY